MAMEYNKESGIYTLKNQAIVEIYEIMKFIITSITETAVRKINLE